MYMYIYIYKVVIVISMATNEDNGQNDENVE